jgi:putative N6-adenine-specific DNA methylase
MAPSASSTRLTYFAAAAPGLESALHQELARLGFDATLTEGGVTGNVSLPELQDLHLRSALAESVRVRLKEFVARDFATLESGLERLPWHAYLVRGAAVEIRVTCHKSRLIHSDAVRERVSNVLERRLGVPRANPPELARSASMPIYLRLMRDRVTPSIGASGELLHRRGYRVHVEQAPLRETLAAAMAQYLDSLSEQARSAVADPFCGSGVLPLEWLRRRLAVLPGAERSFAFERWPIHDAPAWQRQRQERQTEAAANAPLEPLHAFASDLSAKATETTASNATRAGVGERLTLRAIDFREALGDLPPGTAILSNPPYGVRLGDARGAQEIYTALDRLLTARVDLRPVVITVFDDRFLRRSQLPWQVLATTRQGGLALKLLGLRA